MSMTIAFSKKKKRLLRERQLTDMGHLIQQLSQPYQENTSKEILYKTLYHGMNYPEHRLLLEVTLGQGGSSNL
jgi:hypothetical protein